MVFSPDLSRALYFEKSQLEPAYDVVVYADVVQITSKYPPIQNPQKPTTLEEDYEKQKANKNKIHGFSNQSRHAMIMFLAKIERVPDLFVTLTYSDDIADKWSLNMRADFERFRHQLEYIYPNITAMWRVEFVPRKTGKHRGKLIPHWHLLVWLPDTVTSDEKIAILASDGKLWRERWHKLTHSEDENHLIAFGCKVEEIKSRRHAYAYCSKYMAKENYEDIEAGRRWGRIGKIEVIEEHATELTMRQYIHFKRLLNAFIKSEAIKRYHRQKFMTPFIDGKQYPISHYLKFYKSFKKMSIATGCSVLGLGYISQESCVGLRTIYKMLRQAREQAFG